jgi:hypothetical protein
MDRAAGARTGSRARQRFSVHAALVVPTGQHERLERVCRYILRPPGCGLVLDPIEFLGRLAVLVPRPRVNLVLSHGVPGSRALGRAQVVGLTESASAVGDDGPGEASRPASAKRPPGRTSGRARGQR